MPAHPSVYAIAGRIALCGVGFGLFQSPNIKVLMASAPHARSGGASGVVATSRLIGQATGAALVACAWRGRRVRPDPRVGRRRGVRGCGRHCERIAPVGSFASVWEHGRMNEAHAASSSDLCVVLTETPGGPPLWRSFGRFPDPSPFRVGYRSSFVTSFAVCGLSCWHMVQVARERDLPASTCRVLALGHDRDEWTAGKSACSHVIHRATNGANGRCPAAARVLTRYRTTTTTSPG